MSQPKINNWQTLRSQLQTRWAAMADREQVALQFAGWTLALLLLWLIAIQPGLRTLRQAPAQLEALELQLQEMQALAAEARAMRATPPVPVALAAQALQAASTHLGAGAKLSVNGDRAVLSVNSIGAEPLQAWLSEARSAARARPLEAKLQRGPNGYTGTIVLVLSGAAP